jgi:formylglycine-generating enzyme required for sulfatase activity
MTADTEKDSVPLSPLRGRGGKTLGRLERVTMSMTDADPTDLERLLDLATELPPRDRAALLDRECAGQPELRARVGELLRFADAADEEGLLVPRTAPTPPAPTVGRQVGRYELMQLIAEGGTGRVYVARHRDMGKLFAVKVLRPELAWQPGALARFHRELRVAGQLDHPNLVAATDAATDGAHYLVTELLTGATVRDLLQSKERLPIADICAIGAQILAGLGFLAARGLVHRDLSPSNLFVTCDGVVKLLDFGLVRLGDRSDVGGRPEDWLTGPLAVLGNPAYMAPEQYRSPRLVDPRADLYGLGCLLYHLLAGCPPYHDAGPIDPATLLEKHAATDRPVPVATLRPDVPAPVAALVDGLLALYPADRPSPPDQLAAILEPFATGADLPALVATTPVSKPTPLPEPVRPRHRARRLFAAVVAAIVLIGITAAVWPRPHPELPDLPPAPAPAAGAARMLQGIEFRFVPAGTFVMGSAPGRDVRPNETPAHQVTLTRPFWMATDPVTVKQFQRFIDQTNYHTSAERTHMGRRQVRENGRWKWHLDPTVTWSSPGFEQEPTHPVVLVSWEDATAYCTWLTGIDPAYSYRLPTEAEWEFACRTGASASPVVPGQPGTQPTTSLPGSRLGLRGMLGTVYQWAGDEFAPYPPGEAIDPFVAPSPPADPSARTRVARGGSSTSPTNFCRPAARVSNAPEYASQGVGFRVVAVERRGG